MDELEKDATHANVFPEPHRELPLGHSKRQCTEPTLYDLGYQSQGSSQSRKRPPKRHSNSEPSPDTRKRQCLDDRNTTDHRIAYWVKEGSWPKEDPVQEVQGQGGNMNRLERVRARPRSTSRKRSEPGASTSSIAASEPKSRDEKSAPYRDVRYEFNLEKVGVFMKDSEQGITQKSRELCKKLLEQKQLPPIDSLFRDDLFDETCRNLHSRNEARVLRDIGMLLVPSAETLRTLGDKSLGSLIESVNESWSNCIPLDATRLTPARPQPDYSLGFRREAFTEEQLQRLEPFIGDVFSRSYFAATYRMYFPFFASEAKCGREGLDVADRQNAHSMAIAVTAVVELFKAVGREKELDGEILVFSVSHDNESVRIYGWYPAVSVSKTTIHRHTIRKFNFTELDGRDKWATDTFTKNVYRVYMPGFLDLIHSAVDQLPHDLLCGIRSDLGGSENSGLSQQLESQSISAANGLGQMTPDSFGRLSSKRQKPAGDSATDVS